MDKAMKTRPYLENLGLFLTYKCQVACSHCLVKAGPHRTETVKEDVLYDWIGQAAAYDGRVRSINFTGGEPFIDVTLFRKLCAFCLSKGLFPTSVTNAYWAESYETAVEVLESIPSLLFLQISADEHHQKEIPFKRVKNAILAAQKVKIVSSVVVCTENEKSFAYIDIINKLAEIVDSEQVRTVVTTPSGRASSAGKILQYEMTDCLPQGACGGTTNPVILPSGRVSPCMGPIFELEEDNPMMVGNLFEISLKEVLDAMEINPVLHFIRTWGPAKLYTMLEENGFGNLLPKQFVKDDVCILCKNLISEPKVRAAITELFCDKDLVETVAYGREHYLEENEMVNKLGLN